MKTIVKKIFTWVLTVSMILSLSVAAMAEETTDPSSSDTGTITISGLETGVTVKGYKIIEATYGTDGNGFAGYQAVNPFTIGNTSSVTYDEIQNIISTIGTENITPAFTETTTSETFTKDGLAAGTYLVLVSGSGSNVYSPMLVSISYDTETSELQSGTLDAAKTMLNNAQAKKTTPDITKKIVAQSYGDTGSTDRASDGNSYGNDVAFGDTVKFKITGTIPSYSVDYTNVTYTITDTIDAGFNEHQNVVVTVGGTDVSSDTDICTISTSTNEDGTKSLVVDFNNDYILGLAALTDVEREVEITYTAEVNEDASINFDPDNNTAKLTYTNSKKETTDGEEHKTYTYTFGIDAELNGSSSTTTHEVTKVGEKTTSSSTSEPLSGAEFTLKNTGTDKEYTATSDENGYLSFTGLDAGEYTLVETKAPAGYTLNSTTHPVVITANYNDDGTLSSYSITIDDKATSTYTATYNADGSVATIDTPDDDATTNIYNTTISELPSTGGRGTLIFTILGCAIMVAAAAFYFAGKKKNNAQ